MRKTSGFTVTDLFCGAGGSSLGAAMAGAEPRLGLNHWPLAIETHNSNFPDADHDCTDVSACDPRRYFPTQVLIASPECTSHSLAKGKKRRAAGQEDFFRTAEQDPGSVRSRSTMWDVPRFAEAHRYDLVIVENVVDIRYWDPYPAWLQAMHCLGYRHREVFLNSMFAHPTPQSRDRIYVVFWRKGNRAPDLDIRPSSWCTRCERDIEAVQSWKPGRTWGRYRRQYVYCCPSCTAEVTPYYYAALNAIDWTIPAERIRDRARPLKERTLERCRYGLERYGRTPLVVRTNMTSGVGCRVRDPRQAPLDTLPGSWDHAVLTPAHSGHVRPGTEPLATQTARQDFALVAPWLIHTRAMTGLEHRVRNAAAEPGATQTADLDFGVAFPPSFVLTYRNYEGAAGYPLAALTDPLRTIVAHTQERLVINGAALLSLRDWKGGPLVRTLADALPTQVANGPQDAIVSRSPFLVPYYRTGNPVGMGDPMGTLPGHEKWGLVDPSTEDVLDCFFRMLQPPEVGAGMAFPATYTVLGNKRDQTRQYGNAVTPPAMQLLVERGIASLEAA